MNTNTRVGLTLVGGYLIFLIATVPAPLVTNKLGAHLAPLAAYDVSGSLWSGHAGAFNYAALRVANVDWSLHPLALLLGRLEAGWKLHDAALEGSGAWGRTLGGSHYLSKLKASADLQALQNGGLLRIPLPVNGRARFDIKNLRYSDGKLSAADGSIDVNNVVTLVPALTLGDFHLQLETQQAGVKATLSDRGGPLRAQGIAMINPDGSYQFTGNFSARDPNQANLQQYLRMMGPMGADGRVSVNSTGHL
jgi:hypothetical protein